MESDSQTLNLEEQIQIFYSYHSCSGHTWTKKTVFAINLDTGEKTPLFNAKIEKVKGRTKNTCAPVRELLARRGELVRLEQQGNIVFFMLHRTERSLKKDYWAYTKDVKLLETVRDGKGWFDKISVDGTIYKVYRDSVVRVN